MTGKLNRLCASVVALSWLTCTLLFVTISGLLPLMSVHGEPASPKRFPLGYENVSINNTGVNETVVTALVTELPSPLETITEY